MKPVPVKSVRPVPAAVVVVIVVVEIAAATGVAIVAVVEEVAEIAATGAVIAANQLRLVRSDNFQARGSEMSRAFSFLTTTRIRFEAPPRSRQA